LGRFPRRLLPVAFCAAIARRFTRFSPRFKGDPRGDVFSASDDMLCSSSVGGDALLVASRRLQ